MGICWAHAKFFFQGFGFEVLAGSFVGVIGNFFGYKFIFEEGFEGQCTDEYGGNADSVLNHQFDDAESVALKTIRNDVPRGFLFYLVEKDGITFLYDYIEMAQVIGVSNEAAFGSSNINERDGF